MCVGGNSGGGSTPIKAYIIFQISQMSQEVTDYSWTTLEECLAFWQKAVGQQVCIKAIPLPNNIRDHFAVIRGVTIRSRFRHPPLYLYLDFAVDSLFLFTVELKNTNNKSYSLTSIGAKWKNPLGYGEEICLQPLFTELRLPFILLGAAWGLPASSLWQFRNHHLCDFRSLWRLIQMYLGRGTSK